LASLLLPAALTIGCEVHQKNFDFPSREKETKFFTAVDSIAASGPTIWTSTYGLEPVLYNRLLIEPSGWAQTVHMITQRFT